MDSKRNGEELVQIFVDADACPVVGIIETMAEKYNIPTTLLCDTNHVLSSQIQKRNSRSGDLYSKEIHQKGS